MPPSTVVQKLQDLDSPLSAKQVSEILSVPRNTIFTWTRQNKIPHQRILGVLRYNPCELATWLAKQ